MKAIVLIHWQHSSDKRSILGRFSTLEAAADDCDRGLAFLLDEM
jgi:hypothetical protein